MTRTSLALAEAMMDFEKEAQTLASDLERLYYTHSVDWQPMIAAALRRAYEARAAGQRQYDENVSQIVRYAALEAERDALRAKFAKAAEALKEARQLSIRSPGYVGVTDKIVAALAELEA